MVGQDEGRAFFVDVDSKEPSCPLPFMVSFFSFSSSLPG